MPRPPAARPRQRASVAAADLDSRRSDGVAVDARTENEIVSALREAMTGRTTFVVSRRLSLLRRADLILVLEDGRLTQSGTHDELVHRPGPYHETALLQIMDL